MALNLVTTTVLKDTLNAYLDGTITLEFDQDIDPASVTASTVVLYLLPNYNPYAITTSVTGKVLSITPSPSPLLINSSYELLIVSGAGGIKSLASEELATNVITPFSTLNLLKPSTPPVDPATIEESYSNVQQVIGDPVNIVVPDTDIQGDIVPFAPCEPGNFGNDSSYLTPSGIPQTITASQLLKITTTDPEPYAIGVTDLSVITIYWDEPITVPSISGAVEITYEDLNWPLGAFTKTSVTISSINVIGNQMIIQTSGLPLELTNLEFTLTIKALRVQSLDGLKTNGTEKIHWLGTLDPLLCTIDMAQANAGLWGEVLSPKDIFYYTKQMYLHSVTVLRGSQRRDAFGALIGSYTDISQVPDEELSSMAKYVCCSTALDMLTNGTNPGSGGGRAGLFIKKRVLPGVTVEYGNFFGTAVAKGDTGSPAQESMKKLMECINDHKPTDERIMENGGPMAMATGTKSLYDTSFSIPVRRRL